jgi:hypothetical protein
MKIFLAAAALLSGIFFLLSGCGKDCEPQFVQNDEIIYLDIVRPNGTSIIKYAGNNLPADSVRITNLTGGGAVPRYLIRDSILTIDNYNKTAGFTNTFKIEVGATGYRKPDTLTIAIYKPTVTDNCGNDLPVVRFSSFRLNNNTLCTNCPFNQIYKVQKPF